MSGHPTQAEQPIGRPLTSATDLGKGKQQARMVRVTVNLPSELVDRLRDAVYWNPGLTLAWFMAQAIRSSLAELEATHRGPFPKRAKPLRAGRPRLLGQSMKVRPHTPGNGTAHQTEGRPYPGLSSHLPGE